MACHFDFKGGQEQLRHCASGDPGSRLACARPFQHVSALAEVVLEASGQVGMSRAGRGERLILCAGLRPVIDRKGILPVRPILVFDEQGNRRADGLAQPHPGEILRPVGFNLHASAAAIAPLTATQLLVHEVEVHLQACRQTLNDGDQSLAVRFTGGLKAQCRHNYRSRTLTVGFRF